MSKRRAATRELRVVDMEENLAALGYFEIEYQYSLPVGETRLMHRFFAYTDTHMVVDIVQNEIDGVCEVWDSAADEDSFVRQAKFIL